MIIVCPVCRNKTTWEENPWRPFCSERCKLIDFGKWLTEEYSISVEDKGQGKEKEKEVPNE